MTAPTPETSTPPRRHTLRIRLALEPTTFDGRDWPGVVSEHEIDVRSLDAPNIASTAYDVCAGIAHAVEARLRSVVVERDFARMLAENRLRTGVNESREPDLARAMWLFRDDERHCGWTAFDLVGDRLALMRAGLIEKWIAPNGVCVLRSTPAGRALADRVASGK